MKWLLQALLALSLAGCADRKDLAQEIPAKVAPSRHVLSRIRSIPHESLASRAQASKVDVSQSTTSLMECVSTACKTQCASGLEKNSRPKWCMYFKEPIDRHAVTNSE